MQKKYLYLRGIVWFISVYQVLLGIILNSSPAVIVWAATNFLGATKMPDISALFLARALGTYMIALGIGIGIAAWDPVKNRALLSVGAILVGLRAIQRIIQAQDLEQMLGISKEGNLITIVFLSVLAAMLLYFRLKLHYDMKKSV